MNEHWKVCMYNVGMIGSTRSFDKQRLVIQIAMNSIENQPLWNYEQKKHARMAVAQ